MPLVLIDHMLIPEPTTSLRGMPSWLIGSESCDHPWNRGWGQHPVHMNRVRERKGWVPQKPVKSLLPTAEDVGARKPHDNYPHNKPSAKHSTPRGAVWAGSFVDSTIPSGDSVSWRLPLTSPPLKSPLGGAVVSLHDPTPMAPGRSYARKISSHKTLCFGGRKSSSFVLEWLKF